MSFEMKYDRDGNPLKQPELEAVKDQPVTEAVSGLESTRDVLSQIDQETVSDEMSQPAESNESEAEVAQEIEEEFIKPQQVGAPHSKNKPVRNNLTILREKAEQAERRAQEAERLLQQYSSQKQQEYEQEDEPEDISLDEDSLVEGKHLAKVYKEVRQLKNQLKQYEQKSTVSAVELKLKAQYPDFDNVVSGENLANLKAAYPEIAQTINSSSDLYSKAVSAYTMIKKLGISEPVDVYSDDKARALKNAAKPRSMASISPQQGESPLSKANAFATDGTLSKDLKDQLWKEMNSFRR